MGSDFLTTNQRRILESAGTAKDIVETFYFTGGTALSGIYFHHRTSEDLDFFSETPYREALVHAWVRQLKTSVGVVHIEEQVLRGQHIFFVECADHNFVKVDFAYFPFSPVGPFTAWMGLRVSSVEDIAVNKIQALLTRTRARDYVDLYVCLTHTALTLDTLLASYRLKFDVHIQEEQLLTCLTNVSSAVDMPRFLGNTSWKTVELFFLRLAKQRGKMLFGP